MAYFANKVWILLVISFAIYAECSASSYYARAVIESCQGCSLNRLPDVKKFIFEDVPHYTLDVLSVLMNFKPPQVELGLVIQVEVPQANIDRVEFEAKHGAKPELILYKENDEMVERLPLSQLTREECNELLVSKGFVRDTKPPKDEI